MADDFSSNPFDELYDQGSHNPALTYKSTPDPANDNPYDTLYNGPGTPESSTAGAFARGAERGVVPAAGGLVGAGAGAEAGAAIGGLIGAPFGGVGAGPGALAGGVIGGVAGAFGGSYAADKAQDYALSKAPDSWKESIGQDDRQQRLDAEQHPYASFLGGMAPYALTMRPGGFGAAAKALPENATALQRILANPVTARVFGGALMGGVELGQEATSGESPDWAKIAISTGFGLVFNKPTRLGEAIEGAVPRLFRGAPGEIAASRPLEEQEGIIPQPDLSTFEGLHEPTVAQAGEYGVMGAGFTEDTFFGWAVPDQAAWETAQDTVRTENQLFREPRPPDLDAIARRAEPELFGQYDALNAQRETFRDQIARLSNPPDEDIEAAQQRAAALQTQIDQHLAERGGYAGGPEARRLRAQLREAQAVEIDLQNRRQAFATGEGVETPELATARQQFQAVDFQLRDMGREIAAARRRAADAVGAETVEPEPIPPQRVTEAPLTISNYDPIKFMLDAADLNAGRDVKGPVAIHSDGLTLSGAPGGETIGTRVLSVGGAPVTKAEIRHVDGKTIIQHIETLPGAQRKSYAAQLVSAVKREFPDSQIETSVRTEAGNAFFNKHFPSDAPLRVGGPIESTAVPRTIEQQRGAIEADVRQKLLAAGRPADEAEASAKLTSALYETHAERMKGESGTAEEIYRREAPDIRAGRQRAKELELAQGARGKIKITDGRSVLTLMRDANASTYVHEIGHDWLERLLRDAENPAATDGVKADAAAARKWAGFSEDKPTVQQTKPHEKFARGFEQYLREGVAPSKRLASVFAKFRNWLTEIYQTIKGLGSPINEDIRGVFDRMLSTEPQRIIVQPERASGPSLADIHLADAVEVEPREADAAADRVDAEREQAAIEPPGEIAHEIAEAESQFEVAASGEGDGRAGTDSTGEAGGGDQRLPEVEHDRGQAGSQAAGGGVGGGPGAQRPGVGAASAESDRISTGDGGAGGSKSQPLAPKPAEWLGARESPFLDKAGNIRIENLTTSEDVAKAIRDAAEENDEFIGDRRGRITDGQVQDLAAALGLDAQKLSGRKVGEAWNAEQVVAARKLLIQSAIDVSAAMKRAAIGTDEDVMLYAQAKDRHQMIQGQVAGITAEAGRALRAFRSLAGGEGAAGAAATDQFIKQATGKTLFQLREEAKLGSAYDSPEAVSKFMLDAQHPTFGRMILEYWINGLISGPATHTTYMIGNLILALEKVGPETATAALIGQVRAALGREGETVRLGEVAAQLRGGGAGLAPALKAAAEAFRTGLTGRLPGEKARDLPLQPGTQNIAAPILDEAARFTDAMASSFGIIRGTLDGVISGAGLLRAGGIEGSPVFGARYSHLGAIPDLTLRGVAVLPLGTAVRLPSRFIASIHSFFRAMNYSMAKAGDAYHVAANEGLTGTAFDARIADIRQNPTAEQMAKYVSSSTELTLMGQGSQFVQALGRLTNTEIFGFPILKFIDPFVHIAGNIIDQSIIQRTPVGLLAPEIRADLAGRNGNVAQDTAAARMLVGTALSIGFGGLAAKGLMSGSGPSDPRKATMWRLAGNQAHSVRIGDIWYDVHRLGPLGMLGGIAADMYDVAHVASSGDLLQAGSMLQHAFTQNILDESFMRGPAELIQALEDPGRYGEQYIKNFFSSFIPYSVGVGQFDRATDPYTRQARTVMDSIKQHLPGLSETLFPRRDIFGEPLPNHDALISSGLTAIYESQMSRDPVIVAMTALGMGVGPVPRSIRNVKLDDAQYDDFARLAGRMTKMRLDQIVRSVDYAQWPPHTRRDVITEVIKQSREAARGLMMQKFPAIASEAVKNRMLKEEDDSVAQ